LYHLDQKQAALQGTLPLWRTTKSQPTACSLLFDLMLSDHLLNQTHIDERIRLALSKNNSALAFYLLQRSGAVRRQELQWFNQITHHPKAILTLKSGPLSGALYTYGLKLMVVRDMTSAKTLWLHPQTALLLNTDESQQFLAYMALYKAMRNQGDAEFWLAQVKPGYYTSTLRDWEIRYALMHQNWKKILQLTADKNAIQAMPQWQYWRARALGALGHSQEAQPYYQQLAQKRSYYGFLASRQLRQPMQFERESAYLDLNILTVYAPITDKIRALYQSKQSWLAARMLNEFSSELPKPEKSALTYWVAQHLHWPGRAIYLSSSDEALFNQLSLRFPFHYQSIIQQFSEQYRIPTALIYAIIRQESTFQEDIQSQAGAYGLMQVLPRTAKMIAKSAKMAYFKPNDLFFPKTNIQFGVAYLKLLSHQFHAHPLLMAAAYNAGPKQVQHWIKHHPPKDIDIWIETLPWQETRNYLKNIIAFYAVYQYKLHQSPNIECFMQSLS
ncbi:MAG TPA: transglycosylase SLT domain-containing protein, partial [Legionellaceae bacterium]|nr:transglycosylase SLT domain-containing protein [Legionellaceae bacterium]